MKKNIVESTADTLNKSLRNRIKELDRADLENTESPLDSQKPADKLRNTIRNKLKEDFIPETPNYNKVIDAIDNGVLDWETVGLACLRYMSEDDIEDMCAVNCMFDDESEDDLSEAISNNNSIAGRLLASLHSKMSKNEAALPTISLDESLFEEYKMPQQ